MPKISSRGAAESIRAIADAARRWNDADFPPRVRVTSALARRTGYTTPVIDYALDRLFEPLDATTLEASIAEELGSLDVLDRFVERAAGRRARAYPVGNVTIVSSETTVGVALVPAVYALCANNRVLVKDREDALIAAFFDSLADESPELAARAKARSWSGEDALRNDVELRLADAVVAFGRDATLAAIRDRLRPGARFIGHGHRASIGYVARRALADEPHARAAAQGAARDLVLYDGEGCMSLHALFVERDGSVEPVRFVELLLAEVEAATVEFPTDAIDPRVASYQTGAAFRAALGRGSVFRTADAGVTLVIDPPHETPPPFLPRVLPIFVVDGAGDCEEYVRSHALPLEAFALAVDDDGLVEIAAGLGAVRIARLGEMQAPSPALHHGGRMRIADFVRWVERT